MSNPIDVRKFGARGSIFDQSPAPEPKCPHCRDSKIERYDAGHGNIGERECSYCCDNQQNYGSDGSGGW